jgi:putative hydrolase of the HAD superfamily
MFLPAKEVVAMSDIRDVIFDLGAVLLRWSPEAIVAGFSDDAAVQARLLETVFRHPDWQAMDLGQMTEAEALPRMAARVGLSEPVMACLMAETRAYLQPLAPMVEILEACRLRGLGCYALTNMPAEMFDYLEARIGFFQLFNGIVVSAREGLAKPDPAIYRLTLARYGLKPGNTLFIDDKVENIDGARVVGLHGIQYTACDAVQEKIRQILELCQPMA